MGNVAAMGMAAAIGEGLTSLEHALAWHLTVNHFPPIPRECVATALEAIDRADAGEWSERIELPPGITYREQTSAPVSAIVDAWHLDAFVSEGPDTV